MIANIQTWLTQNPDLARWIYITGVSALIVVSYIATTRLVVRGLHALAKRTDTSYDDIILRRTRPRRLALVVPLLLIYYFAYLVGSVQEFVQEFCLFLMLWLAFFTLAGLLDAINDIYELRRGETGVAIRGYLDLVKVFGLVTGVILSISIFTGESPLGLLAGLGALTAVLLFIFRDTILSFIASVQIASNDLVIEGDWLEVPAYDADGEVIDITLHQIKIQNWDMAISVVPTYKLMETSYRNWRGMSDSGGRRIKRSIYINLHSIRFVDEADTEKFRSIPLIKEYIEAKQTEIQGRGNDPGATPEEVLYQHQLTNVSVFRAYVEAYIRHHPRIRQDMSLLVRQLAPGPSGLPIEIYAFTDTTAWEEYEAIQAGIFDHLLAVVPVFNLRVFQARTSGDILD